MLNLAKLYILAGILCFVVAGVYLATEPFHQRRMFLSVGVGLAMLTIGIWRIRHGNGV